MSWRDRLQQASFRDVPFKVLSIITETGRRTVLHQYPFNDEPYAEDLGKDAGIYSVTGYIVQTLDNGFDYFAERDALITALNKKGPGTLVHPWYGPLNVSLMGRVQIRESFSEGGIARFTMTFVEAGRVQVPAGDIALENTADNAADAVEADAKAEFEDKYESGPLSLLADATAFLNMVQSTMYKIQSTVTSKISEALTTVAEIRDTVTSIIEDPGDLADAISNTFDTYKGLFDSSEGTSLAGAFLELSKVGETDTANASLYGGTFDVIPSVDTETRDIQRNNREHFLNYVRTAALVEAVRAATYADYDDFDAAYQMLQDIMDAIERIQAAMDTDITGDAVYDALESVKSTVVSILLQKGASAPVTLYKIVPPDPKPSLLYAYELYDDLDRESEIISRNREVMLHPGFPKGGESLEVASE